MSEEPSPSTPRVVQTARQLGYLAAVLGAFDILWCALAWMIDHIPAHVYSVGMMLFSAAAVVSGIFSLLIQTDHRRAKREARRHAESMEVQQDILAGQRRIVGWIAGIDERMRHHEELLSLLRKSHDGWQADITRGVMQMSADGERRMAEARTGLAVLRADIETLAHTASGEAVDAVIHRATRMLATAVVAERKATDKAIAGLATELREEWSNIFIHGMHDNVTRFPQRGPQS